VNYRQTLGRRCMPFHLVRFGSGMHAAARAQCVQCAAVSAGTATARKDQPKKKSKAEKKDIKKLKKQEEKLREANIKSVEKQLDTILPRAILIDVIACLSMYDVPLPRLSGPQQKRLTNGPRQARPHVPGLNARGGATETSLCLSVSPPGTPGSW
jgi:hypothetical protein